MTEEKKKVRKRFLPYTNDIIAKCLFIEMMKIQVTLETQIVKLH